ncbi:NAD(P)H-hydrate dehydratase [Pedococcus sp.]|uniref:NAD(P)H-hydrate dehydratase n=1 Tax=Pedococcus sp. TaxID=2860345 RepID=UPI002E0F9A18|nr:NAD(P)H-hydrate dehydratase [Pedococcus sp.]
MSATSRPSELRAAEAQALDLRALGRWPLPDAGGGKEGRGQVLVVGGSRRTPGSVLLAAEAALRSGAGKVQVATVESVAVAVSVALPEALVCPLPETAQGEIDRGAAATILGLAEDSEAVLLGPGLTDPESARVLMEHVVPDLRGPVAVLDALAMAYLTAHRDGVAHLDGRVVLSPNLVELATTLQVDEDTVAGQLAQRSQELARTAGAVVVTGGEQTVVSTVQGEVWLLDDPLPGLGSAGSGDVKAGVIAGLAARGLEPEAASVWGVHLHHAAGRRLARQAPVGFLARELLPCLPGVMRDAQAALTTG